MMQTYRHSGPRQKSTGLKVIRLRHECVEACSLGTDDAAEFAEHLAVCLHILPAVQAEIKKRLARGEAVVVEPKRIGDHPGQMDLLRALSPPAGESAGGHPA